MTNDLSILKNFDGVILNVRTMYQKFPSLNADLLVNVLCGIDFSQQASYFLTLVYALYTKKIRAVDYLNFLSLTGVVSEMMMSYINKFRLDLFMMRFLNFTYTHMLFDLLANFFVNL